MQLQLKKQLLEEECTFEPIIITRKSKDRKTLFDSDFAQTQQTDEKSRISNDGVYVRNS